MRPPPSFFPALIRVHHLEPELIRKFRHLAEQRLRGRAGRAGRPPGDDQRRIAARPEPDRDRTGDFAESVPDRGPVALAQQHRREEYPRPDSPGPGIRPSFRAGGLWPRERQGTGLAVRPGSGRRSGP